MSRFSISARDARALRMGALVVLPVLTMQLVIRPYASAMTVRHDELRAERALLSRELRAIQERARYDTVATEAQRLLIDAEQLLFIGTDEVLAAALLTRHVSDLAPLAPVLIQQIETAPAAPIFEEFVSIELSIRGESDLEGLLTFLRDLEFGSKLLTIPSLRIEPVTARERENDDLTVLGFSATLRGYAILRPQTLAQPSVTDTAR